MIGDISGNHKLAADHNHGSKRRPEDSSAGHTRVKRNRYVSVACNECKRRKIKCNGDQPCQRCGNLCLECIYAPNCCPPSLQDSQEFQHMRSHITSLQHQVDSLFSSLNTFRRHLSDSYPSPEASHAPTHCGRLSPVCPAPSFSPSPGRRKFLNRSYGPISNEDGFEGADSTLQTMEIAQESTIDENIAQNDDTATLSPPSNAHPNSSDDPMWLISRQEAIRLCTVYEEEIGIMYPLFEIEAIIDSVHKLWAYFESGFDSAFGRMPGRYTVNDDDVNLVKVVLAAGLVLEGNGQSQLGQRIFESLRPAVTEKFWDPADIKGISLICVSGIYYFNRGDERQAWRLVGVAARSCVEMGLHRGDSLLNSIANEAEYLAAVKLFWVVYALDRRWSFGMGLPFALQDADIRLPEPDNSSPYLQQLTKHNHIASKVWHSHLSHELGSEVEHDKIGFLDYQLLRWYEEIPESLRFNRSDMNSENRIASRGHRRLRLMLYLRANMSRILIHRPMLTSCSSIYVHLHRARTVVGIAKDTISVLAKINQTTDIYRTQQVCYNYFLVQSLAVILLAVAHAPAEFAQESCDEFYAALDLVKGFSTQSYASRKLWQTIRGLRKVGGKIGLLASNRRFTDSEGGSVADAHSTPAVAMAGLAGHSIDEIAMFNGGIGSYASGFSAELVDGQELSTELTNLFELARDQESLTRPASSTDAERLDGLGDTDLRLQAPGEGVRRIFGDELEFSRIVDNLL